MADTTWIKAAVDRLSDPRTDWTKYNKQTDQANVNEAQKRWLIKRDADWFIIYSDPTKVWSWIDVEWTILWSNAWDWSSWNRLMTDLEKLIKRKQEILQPTTQEEAYWKSKIKDTTPFWSVRDRVFYETSPSWNFMDQNLRELSPSEQSSVRASRDAAAQAHLWRIAAEREYIGENAASAIKSLSTMINKKMELEAQRLKAAASANKRESIYTNTDKKNILKTFPSLTPFINDYDDSLLSDLMSVHTSISPYFKWTWASPQEIEGYALQFLEAQDNPESPVWWIELLEQAIRKGNWEEAARIFKSNVMKDLTSSAAEPFWTTNIEQ